MEIIFFGSGPVAAKSLKLLAQDFRIEAVVTKPKPDHHRGDFPVVQLAAKLGLKTFTPSNKKELSEIIKTKPIKGKLGVVIDYGIIIGQDVIDYFPLGIINSHFSLLPEWRGADPITFAILSGQKQTGVSLMLITASLDEGPLLAQTPYDMSSDVTTPQLTDHLIDLSHQLLRTVIPMYVNGKVQPAPQELVSIAPTKVPTFSRKLTKEEGIINWQKPAAEIEREIRAFIEWPKSRTVLADKEVIITAAKIMHEQGQPGSIKISNKELVVYCGKDALHIKKLKPAGKNEMTATSFLSGYGHLLA